MALLKAATFTYDKSCHRQISLIKLSLSLLALVTFVRHRRQQISLTARYSLEIHSTPSPPLLNIMPAVASCADTAEYSCQHKLITCVQNNQDEECVLPAISTTKLFQFDVNLKALWGSNYSV